MRAIDIGYKLKSYATRALRGPTPLLENIEHCATAFTVAFPGQHHDFGPENTFDGEPIAFAAVPARTHPAVGIYQMDRGIVRSLDGYVISERKRWVWPTSWFSEQPEELHGASGALRRSSRNVTKLPGRSLSLATDFASGNYGHFLLDSLGRLAVLEKAGLVLSEFDSIIVPGPDKAWKRRLLTKFGVPSEKLVWTNEGDLCCERLVATSFPGVRRSYAPWLTQYLRQRRTGEARASGGPRLFLSRTGTSRRLLNEDALLEIAQEYGFVRYLPESSPDSIEEIADAEAVISPHGAGMSDIAFMRPGTTAIELLPSDHRYSYYFTLARSAELRYAALIGRSTQERPAGSWGPSTFDFAVEPQKFRRCLELTFGTTS